MIDINRYWGCLESLGETLARPQNKNVPIGGYESASRWHARVHSRVFFTGWGESCETTKLPWAPQMTYCAQLSNVTLKTEISEDIMLGKEKSERTPNWWIHLGKDLPESLKKYVSAVLRKLSSYYRYRLKMLFVCTSSWSSHLSSLLEFYKNTLKTSALQKRI